VGSFRGAQFSTERQRFAAAFLQVPLVIHRYTDRPLSRSLSLSLASRAEAASCLSVFIASCLGFPTRRFRLRCRKRRSAQTPGSPLGSLRCGLRSSLLPKASSLSPSLRSVACRPGERGVRLDGCASGLPLPRSPGGILPRASSSATSTVAACSVDHSSWRHRAENSGRNILSSLSAPRFHNQSRAHGRHPAEESGGASLPANEKRPPRGLGLV